MEVRSVKAREDTFRDTNSEVLFFAALSILSELMDARFFPLTLLYSERPKLYRVEFWPFWVQ